MQNIQNIQASPNHHQSIAVLKYLLQNNPNGYNNLQDKVKPVAVEMIRDNTRSRNLTINAGKCGISKVVSHKPKGGSRVVKFYSVEDGSWFKCFTGNNWRVDGKTVFGEMGDVEEDIGEHVNLVIDMEYTDEVRITNITISNEDNVTFGPHKRGVSMAHMVGCITNPNLMNENFAKKDTKLTGKLSGDLDANKDEFSIGSMLCTLAKDAVMPIDETITAESLIQPVQHDEGEGKADNGLCGHVLDTIPELQGHIYIYGENMDGFVAYITDNSGEINQWAKDPDNWEKLFKIMADKCEPTVVKS